MKAIVSKITFYEAFFKVHYTKGSRLTYPIPLPTTVAGIFGAMLGIDRTELQNRFENFYFGAKLLNYDGMIIEHETFIQFKTMKVEKGVVHSQIINHPTYLIALAGEDKSITKFYDFLRSGNLIYLPYGGQNDFFVEDIRIIGLADVINSNVISNYAPQDMVKALKSKEIMFNILPVMHTYSDNPNFYFVLKGELELKESVKIIENEGVAVYPLEMFKFVKV